MRYRNPSSWQIPQAPVEFCPLAFFFVGTSGACGCGKKPMNRTEHSSLVIPHPHDCTWVAFRPEWNFAQTLKDVASLTSCLRSIFTAIAFFSREHIQLVPHGQAFSVLLLATVFRGNTNKFLWTNQWLLLNFSTRFGIEQPHHCLLKGVVCWTDWNQQLAVPCRRTARK